MLIRKKIGKYLKKAAACTVSVLTVMSFQLVTFADDYYTDDYSTDDYYTDDYSTDGYYSTDDYSTDDYSDDGYYTDDYSTDDYSTDDYTTDDYSTDDYSTDDYSTDDYSTDDYTYDYSTDDNTDAESSEESSDDENAEDPVVLASTPEPVYTPNPNIAVPSQSGSYYILDNASVISDEVESQIDELGSTLYKDTGAQVVLVTISTTRYSLKDYAYTLFNQWKIGGDGQYGLLFLLDIEDDLYYSYAGNGLKTQISSTTLSELNNIYLEPYFAERKYDDAALAVYKAGVSKTESAMELIGPVGTPDPAMIESSQTESSEAASESSVSDTPTSVPDSSASGSTGILSTVIKIGGIVLLAVFGICAVALIVIVLHGKSAQRKRKEAKKHKNRNNNNNSSRRPNNKRRN